jgi:magnesium chelatase family protein
MDERPVTIGCGAVVGVDAIPVTIEATMRGERTAPRILGSVDANVREALHRVLNAFTAQGLDPPRGMPTLNFVPASIRKSGCAFDLPMALALAGADGLVPRQALDRTCAFGEVSLEGHVLPARGVVAVAVAARMHGYSRFLTGPDDAARAAVVPGLDVVAVPTLRDAILVLRDALCIPPTARVSARAVLARGTADRDARDLADIRGHETAKIALAVAAAGRHNLLMVGPPGSGKSALMQRLGGLLPPTTDEECLEVLKIHSAGGSAFGERSRFGAHGRPLRAPHHTSSVASLLGGGPDPRPGEATLAQHGVLFLDELAEFRREALEGLRQPLEDGIVTIGRAQRTVTMPADFLLVAAMNPCPCGYAGSSVRECVCSAAQLHRYRGRISGPLLDRFDLSIEMPTLPAERFHERVDAAWTTAAVRDRVAAAAARQMSRNRGANGPVPNGRLEGRWLDQAVGRDPAMLAAVDQVMRAYRLSGRARVRLLRTARTLADLDECAAVGRPHVLEAARVRGFDAIRG